jgi:tetratricopeptide (TPR) repeat protein
MELVRIESAGGGGSKEEPVLTDSKKKIFTLIVSNPTGDADGLIKKLKQLGVLYFSYSSKMGMSYPRDIFTSTDKWLLVTRKSDQLRQYLPLLHAKLTGDNLAQVLPFMPNRTNPRNLHPILHDLGENTENLPIAEDLNQWLKIFFPKDRIANQKVQKVAGGNLMKVVDPKDGSTILFVGEYSAHQAFIEKMIKLKGENYKFDADKAIYKRLYDNFLKGFIKDLKSDYNLGEIDKVIILPQASYHLDLDMIVIPGKGVLLADYTNFFFKPPRRIDGFIEQLQRMLISYPEIFNHKGDDPYLPEKITIERILCIKQSILDKVATILQKNGIKVIRAPGNCPISAMFKNFLDIKTDFFQVFNFFNSVAVNTDGADHLICLNTFPELNYIRDEFGRVLSQNGITPHFVQGREESHSSNILLTQINHAGLHCITNDLFLEEDLVLAMEANQAFKKEDYERAKVIYLKAHEVNPTENKYLLKAAKMETYLQNYKNAITIYQKVNPDSDSKTTHKWFKDLGTKAYKEKKYEKANRLYLLAHNADVMGYECLSNAALTLVQLKRYSEAIKIMQEVVDKAKEGTVEIKPELVTKNQNNIEKYSKLLKGL